ncbi:hypothetical protein [Muricoccus roseus]|uniref:hypothetical protein n=1 Tax=Muricoccus roseus TaxID=198092 RepID=UPI0009326D01|nr:hypothetical protein [Roseomonas rosea]
MSAPPRRIRLLRQLVPAVLAALLLLGAWLALPWLLAVRISIPLGQGDAPGLLRQFDRPAAMASLRAGLAAQVPEGAGDGAQRFLTDMAQRMADSWARPESVAAWLAARSRPGRVEDGMVALSHLRSARPLGLASFRLEYGPAQGEGGVSFDLAWQGDGFRVTGLRFLDQPPRPLPAPPTLRAPVLAMR